jgi:hypothetical protein
VATSAPGCTLLHPRELRWISTVCRGGRPRERGIEVQKAPYIAPDRFRPGFEPPLTDVSWVGLTALAGYAVRLVRPPYARAHASRASVRFVPSLLEAAFHLASLVRTGSPGTSRIVPPLRLIELSPFPRNEGGPRQKEHHQPLLSASDLDLSPLSRVCPGLGSQLWGYAVRSVRSVRGSVARVSGFGRAYETR